MFTYLDFPNGFTKLLQLAPGSQQANTHRALGRAVRGAGSALCVCILRRDQLRRLGTLDLGGRCAGGFLQPWVRSHLHMPVPCWMVGSVREGHHCVICEQAMQ